MGLQVFRVTGLIRFKVYRAFFGFTGLIGVMQFIGFTGFRVEYLWVYGLVSMSLGCRALDFKVYAAHTVLRLHRLSGLFGCAEGLGLRGNRFAEASLWCFGFRCNWACRQVFAPGFLSETVSF